jgi:type I restriction enzyme S subunit
MYDNAFTSFFSRINDNLAETKSAIFNELFDSKLANGLNGKLQDITDLKTGKRPKNKFNQRDSKAIYPIIGATKVMGFTTDYLYDESVITIGRVGTHGVVQRYREPIWVSDNSFIFLSEHEDYLYELLSHRIKYSSLNVGSTQPLITQSDLKNIDIYVPTKQEFSIFEERTAALTKYQFKLNKQSSTLKALQNSLLDKYF